MTLRLRLKMCQGYKSLLTTVYRKNRLKNHNNTLFNNAHIFLTIILNNTKNNIIRLDYFLVKLFVIINVITIIYVSCALCLSFQYEKYTSPST